LLPRSYGTAAKIPSLAGEPPKLLLHGQIRLKRMMYSTTKDIDHDQIKSISTKTAPSAKYDVHLLNLIRLNEKKPLKEDEYEYTKAKLNFLGQNEIIKIILKRQI
jgi:hypothetical protein